MNTRYNINTRLVMEALTHYSRLGYQPVEVPLLIDPDVSQFTSPSGKKDLAHNNGQVYVASAEQSFYQLMKDGELGAGKYMALTPCYRDEDTLDQTHLNIFLKLELFVVGDSDYIEVLTDAYSFFSQCCESSIVQTEFGHDIESGGVELGSYGTRVYKGVSVCYGTGIAEPRLSYVINGQAS